MHLAHSRSLFFLAFIACALIMGGVFYLEYGVGLEPCPLCIVQRVFMIAFGLISLAAFLHAPGKIGWRIYSALILLCALAGAGTAGRQVWLQTAPAQDPASCLPGLGYLLQTMPFTKVVSLLFDGTADCIEINWTLFGMSIPEWSLLAFAGLILLAAYQLLQRD
ncbi:disulfide bond formation protein B [Pseudomonas sp. NA-150]|uniref:disulfide bond formation protein B n=1 Tax=Pseudomonas sp. NA-150 TaxID=3367525 RepID=UPI0037CA2526